MSDDGISWGLKGIVLPPGSSDKFDPVQMRNANVTKIGSQYVMMYSGRENDDDYFCIGRAMSCDGQNWVKYYSGDNKGCMLSSGSASVYKPFLMKAGDEFYLYHFKGNDINLAIGRKKH